MVVCCYCRCCLARVYTCGCVLLLYVLFSDSTYLCVCVVIVGVVEGVVVDDDCGVLLLLILLIVLLFLLLWL